MTAAKKPATKGVQTASKPKKLLNGGVDPAVGKATQIKPGQVLNPNGRPKGSKHINTWIQELVSDEEFEAVIVDLKTGFADYKGAPMKAIIKAIINEALAHPEPRVRQAAREQLMKYGWPTKNELTGEDGAPLMPVALDSAILNRLTHGGSTPSSTTTDSEQ